MKKIIIRWTLIGLLIRLLIMPFSFHGHDIFFINYFPYKFLAEGAWNPYLFLGENFPTTMDNAYYPPTIFFIISGFLFLLKPFLPHLNNLFSVFESWNFTCEGNTIHFADILTDHQLFRTLFAFKISYLLLDFGIAWFLFRILKPEKEKALLAYKVWMLNPFVLHSCYALGQISLITTFLIMAAVYCLYANRRYLAMVLLSVGVLTKMFPVLLIPFAILLSGNSFKDRIKLSLAAVMPLIIMVLPFYISSPDAVLRTLFFSPPDIPFWRGAVFILSYLALLVPFLFVRISDNTDLDLIIAAFTVVLLLFYSFYTVTIRYFILVTPLLVYIALKDKRFWIYNIIFLIALLELRAAGNTQQWGLFAALHPEFFSSLPISDSYLNLAVNVLYVHKFMYRVFVISGLAMAAHILVILIKNGVFNFSLKRIAR